MSANDLEQYFSGIKTVEDLYELSQKSRGWFKSLIRQLRKHPIKHKQLAFGDPKHNTKTLMVGKLYIFQYDPKYKATLPIYDKYPLALPFSTDGKTFYALNLHYLPHRQRAWLLYQLGKIYNTNKKETSIRNNKKIASSVTSVIDSVLASIGSKRMRITWGMLSNMPKVDTEKAVKRYLPNHIKSPLREIPAEDYPKIILLPFEQWVYGNKNN